MLWIDCGKARQAWASAPERAFFAHSEKMGTTGASPLTKGSGARSCSGLVLWKPRGSSLSTGWLQAHRTAEIFSSSRECALYLSMRRAEKARASAASLAAVASSSGSRLARRQVQTWGAVFSLQKSSGERTLDPVISHQVCAAPLPSAEPLRERPEGRTATTTTKTRQNGSGKLKERLPRLRLQCSSIIQARMRSTDAAFHCDPGSVDVFLFALGKRKIWAASPLFPTLKTIASRSVWSRRLGSSPLLSLSSEHERELAARLDEP